MELSKDYTVVVDGRRAALVDSDVLLYRGAPQEEENLRNRAFPGVFLTVDQHRAGGYGGYLTVWRLSRQVKVLDSSSYTGKKLAQEFSQYFSRGHDEEQQGKKLQYGEKGRDLYYQSQSLVDNPEAIFLFPSQKWVGFLRDDGYGGTYHDGDYCIFDPTLLTRVK